MRDKFDREWITENSIKICTQYELGVLTLRGLHYQLVSLGMTNSIRHYQRVIKAMIKARRQELINYDQFSDHDREKIGETDAHPTDLADQITTGEDQITTGEDQIRAWMIAYSKNRWENQPKYVELWIEKKALQGTFGPVCSDHDVALCPCKGYPSLTFLHDASLRFTDAQFRGQSPTMIYFGDHDPSGEDIPRSIRDNLTNDFGVDVDVQVIGLTKSQCTELGLPAAPIKIGDSRSKNFDGLGQIELDAVRPEILRTWAIEAIADNFDVPLHDELIAQEDSEREEYQAALREYVNSI